MSLPRQQILTAISKARKASPKRNFEQTIELVINLRELDMKRPENRINLRVQLPNGIEGQKVLVFAGGDLALRARRSGADEVIEPTELNELAKDKKAAKKRLKDFDIFISEAPLMPTVGRVAGPILGPRGKMPTPVPSQAPVDNVIERERKAVVLRSRDKPFVHCMVGKESMTDEEVAQNIEAIISNLTSSTKRGFGNIKTMFIKTSMGEAVKLY
ncbi:50S ribosomal protein L1 [Candidatus Bathyarchaeota archaeon]|nr:50S ribosomal protein L1 [Candidatus Bathyarchaeota archaeon]